MIDVTAYRSVLCLNGSLPEKHWLQLGLPIIAADGAANTLMAMGITPNWVVGDLDSVEPHILSQLKSVHHADQNLCDFKKSLLFLEKNQLLPTIILGVNGGELDHILKNVGMIAATQNVFIASPMIGFSMIAGETKQLTLPIHTKLSLIGMPSAIVSSQGLKWELNEYVMNFPGENSFYNQTVANSITLTVMQGVVIVLVHSAHLCKFGS